MGAIDTTYVDGLNANETTVVELNDGTLYINTRDQGGDARGTRGESWSRDGGTTFESRDPKWKNFRPAPAILDPPVVQCALLRAADNLILYSGPDESGPTGKGRSDLRLRYSKDEAQSWKDGPLIHTGPASYSDMVLITPATLGVLFECGEKKSAERIDFARVPGQSRPFPGHPRIGAVENKECRARWPGLRYTSEESEFIVMKVQDLLARDPSFTADPGDTLVIVEKRMADQSVHALPILDEDDKSRRQHHLDRLHSRSRPENPCRRSHERQGLRDRCRSERQGGRPDDVRPRRPSSRCHRTRPGRRYPQFLRPPPRRSSRAESSTREGFIERSFTLPTPLDKLAIRP